VGGEVSKKIFYFFAGLPADKLKLISDGHAAGEE
jgi:hypothetical protein